MSFLPADAAPWPAKLEDAAVTNVHTWCAHNDPQAVMTPLYTVLGDDMKTVAQVGRGHDRLVFFPYRAQLVLRLLKQYSAYVCGVYGGRSHWGRATYRLSMTHTSTKRHGETAFVLHSHYHSMLGRLVHSAKVLSHDANCSFPARRIQNNSPCC